MNRRVVVTGLGLVTPIGIGADAVWARLHEPRSAVTGITRFDASPFRSQMAAEIPDFDPVALLSHKTARRTDRCSQFALVAAQQALTHARLDLAAHAPGRVGVLMGTALGGIGFAEEENTKYVQGGLRAVDPLLGLTVFAGALSCNVAIAHGVTGVNQTNAMSCASGTIAIGTAMAAIRRGDIDVALAGGSEAPLAPLCYGAFALIRAMSTRNDDPARASRPFDAARDGFVMGEGAAVLVLEAEEVARARGATIVAEVAGFAETNDAWHMTQPRPDGREARRAMAAAIADAGLVADDIGWVNAHGSSTTLNDSTEAEAIRAVLGEAADRAWVSATKGWHAHALGASGAIEVAIACLALQHGWLPGTLNLDTPIANGSLRFVPAEGMTTRPRAVLKNSFGFGGANACLVLRREE